MILVLAYIIEFETRTAIPTLQNTFDSGIKKGSEGWGGGGEPIKAGRSQDYLKAAADDKKGGSIAWFWG